MLQYALWALILSLAVGTTARQCPCSSAQMCDRISGTLKNQEQFGFYTDDNKTAFHHFDWSAITTVAWANSSEIMCAAHSHGARVLPATHGKLPFTSDKAARQSWIDSTVAFSRDNFYDGVVFDYESPLSRKDPNRAYFTELVKETTEAFHAQLPGSVVVVCVAWSPNDIDGRDYNYAGLADASDALYVMDYDTRSQIYSRCIAGPNSPSPRAARGLSEYIERGIAADKLILGVPWYGYLYPCKDISDAQSPWCVTKEVPFRGVNCSDASGTEKPYDFLMKMVNSNSTSTGLQFDTSTNSPWYNFVQDHKVHQVWFDNPQSLAAKYKIAANLGARGVGPYGFNMLGYDTPQERAQAAAMWQALKNWHS